MQPNTFYLKGSGFLTEILALVELWDVETGTIRPLPALIGTILRRELPEHTQSGDIFIRNEIDLALDDGELIPFIIDPDWIKNKCSA